MKLIYNNFDGLDISFKCALPPFLLKQMRSAKEEAQKSRREVFISVGSEFKRISIAESGARGGYAFRFDTGIDGETWFIADREDREQWNVRLSVKSLALALYGYSEMKKRILAFLLDDLQAQFVETVNKETGEVLFEHPEARISRFDYCFDFTSESFAPNPKNLITSANRMKKAYHYQKPTPIECYERFNAIESMRIGSMPNRQIAIYNKTREITEKKKPYWWRIWGIEKESLKGKIWRIEVRAGKKELNKWNIRSFTDFEDKAGDAIIGILKAIRYVKPLKNDSNRARWPMKPFWNKAIKAANNDLESFISGAIRNEIVFEYRNELLKQFEKNLNGTITSYAAILGCTIDELPGVLERVSENALLALEEAPKHFEKKHAHAGDKYRFVN
jgi:hypothetical protein